MTIAGRTPPPTYMSPFEATNAGTRLRDMVGAIDIAMVPGLAGRAARRIALAAVVPAGLIIYAISSAVMTGTMAALYLRLRHMAEDTDSVVANDERLNEAANFNRTT
jgi:hypothetical protein